MMTSTQPPHQPRGSSNPGASQHVGATGGPPPSGNPRRNNNYQSSNTHSRQQSFETHHMDQSNVPQMTASIHGQTNPQWIMPNVNLVVPAPGMVHTMHQNPNRPMNNMPGFMSSHENPTLYLHQGQSLTQIPMDNSNVSQYVVRTVQHPNHFQPPPASMPAAPRYQQQQPQMMPSSSQSHYASNGAPQYYVPGPYGTGVPVQQSGNAQGVLPSGYMGYPPPQAPQTSQQQPTSHTMTSMPAMSASTSFVPTSTMYTSGSSMSYAPQQVPTTMYQTTSKMNGQPPQTLPHAGSLPRKKNILVIQDPTTQEVVNKDDIERASHSAEDGQQVSTTSSASVTGSGHTTSQGTDTVVVSSGGHDTQPVMTANSAHNTQPTPTTHHHSHAIPIQSPPQPSQPIVIEQPPPAITSTTTAPITTASASNADRIINSSPKSTTSTTNQQSQPPPSHQQKPAQNKQQPQQAAARKSPSPAPVPVVLQPPVTSQPPPPLPQKEKEPKPIVITAPPPVVKPTPTPPAAAPEPEKMTQVVRESPTPESKKQQPEKTITADITLNGQVNQSQQHHHSAAQQMQATVLAAVRSKPPPAKTPEKSSAADESNDSVTFGDVDRKSSAVEKDTPVVTLPNHEPESPVSNSARSPLDRGDSQPPLTPNDGSLKVPDGMSQSMVVTPSGDDSEGSSEAELLLDVKTALESEQEKHPETYNCFTKEGSRSYGKEMMHAIENIIRQLKPPMPEKLEAFDELRQDRQPAGPSGGHKSLGYGDRSMRANFTPNFMQSGGGPGPGNQYQFQGRKSQGGNRYQGRPSDRQQNRGPRNQPQKVFQPSISYDVQLKTSDNAWKPGQLGGGASSQADQTEVEKTLKKIRGVLNKITPQYYDDLKNEFFEMLKVDMEKVGPQIIQIIFNKAVDEPTYCELYSKLCKEQVAIELKRPDSQNRSMFRNHILGVCQEVFKSTEDKRRVAKESEKEEREAKWREVADQLKKTDKAEYEKEKALYDKDIKSMEEFINDLANKERRRMFGNIRFIGELYKNGLIIATIITHCLKQLFNQTSTVSNRMDNEKNATKETKEDLMLQMEEATECAVKLLASVGSTFEREQSVNAQSRDAKTDPVTGKDMVDQCFMFLHSCVVPKVKPRIRFAIDDLNDLRKNNWVPRRKVEGPKRIDQVHNEVKQEQLQKEIDQQQRAGGRGSRDGPRPQVVNRPSLNREYQGRNSQGMPGNMQRQRATEMQAPSLNVRAGLLSKHTKPPFGGVATTKTAGRSWATGASGGTTTYTAPEQFNNTTPRLAGSRRRGGPYPGRDSQESAKDSRSASRDPSLNRQDQLINKDRAEALRAAHEVLTGKPKSVNQRQSDSSQSELSSIQPSPAPTPDLKAEPLDDSQKESRRRVGALAIKELLSNWSSNDKSNEKQIEESIPQMMSESATQTENYEIALVGALDAIIDAKHEQKSSLMKVMGRLVNACIHKHSMLTGTVNGMVTHIERAIEMDVLEDVPRFYDYVGQMMAHMLEHATTTSRPSVPALGDFAPCFKSATHDSAKMMLAVLTSVMAECSETEDDAQQNWLVNRWRQWGEPSIEHILEDAQSGAYNKLLQLKDGQLAWLPDKLIKSTGTSAGSANTDNKITNALLNTNQVVIELERELKDLKTNDSLRDEDKANHIIDTFKGYFTEPSAYSVVFAQALAIGICDIVFVPKEGTDEEDPEYELDKEQFAAYSKVFLRFVTGNSDCELAALKQLSAEVVNKSYPRGAMIDTVDAWLRSRVVPSDTLRAWYKGAQDPMIKQDGSLKKIIESSEEEDFDDDDEDDEEDDEGEST